MKFSAITLLAAAAGLAAAKTLEDYVPKCSQQCLKDAQSSATDCKEGDLPCFCILENYHNIYDAGVSCVLLKCGNDVAVGEVLPAIVSMCDAELPGGASGALPSTVSTTGIARPTDADAATTVTTVTASTTSGEGKATATSSSAAPTASDDKDSSAGSLVAGLGAAVPLVLAAML
ncbi:hypothetical protein SMACR_09018 [Sordaria macrospora]|uniref:WGS project CABT00000000 data, contig 2.31 n=2 Tax=Sordaria macrospora TaxID=5147 RepID=F7W5N5_SORMK|nr:uncharacterized protein SMAC_09018 [Sordaria macrospora k-hell]KAA8635499.1 hypothetical protein SMACR_09018 [Sordaria macrospora]KAH7629545.1 hypothetical protein B0T09DRAFT_358483 [Sordaria sp. MPI-SDFR-AT-0083]WPJ66242.1 hypothetical protein SMAC4_09018 [Sordaria macrospora]CCC12823.1 unnamed protein product [Sordaria macrospora k-hell]